MFNQSYCTIQLISSLWLHLQCYWSNILFSFDQSLDGCHYQIFIVLFLCLNCQSISYESFYDIFIIKIIEIAIVYVDKNKINININLKYDLSIFLLFPINFRTNLSNLLHHLRIHLNLALIYFSYQQASIFYIYILFAVYMLTFINFFINN